MNPLFTPTTQISKAIELAHDYIEAHYFKKRLSDGDRNHRRNISEAIRLGGMRKILDALIVQRDALESISKNTCCDKCQEAALFARSVLERGEVEENAKAEGRP